jgi:uncharacterized protein with PQ loop repeat
VIESFLENHIATIATFFLITAYLPQVIKTYRTKVVDGISLSFWALISTALGCLLINATFLFLKYGTYGYLIMEAFNFGLAFVMLVMVLKYRKKEAK